MKYLLSTALLAAGTLSAACSPPRDAEGKPVAVIPKDSTAYYREQFERVSTMSIEKDSLVADLAEATRLIADVNTELASIEAPRKGVQPVVASESEIANSPTARAAVLGKVKDLTARVKQSESRLASSQRRLRALSRSNDSLSSTLASYEASLNDLKAIVEDQKKTITTITAELDQLRERNLQLATANTELTDSLTVSTTRENTVYYLIGKKKDLIQQGIIREEGGTRFLLVTRTGETLRPATNLDPAMFTMADRRTLHEIMPPSPDKEYRVVSRQDLAYASASSIKPTKGTFKGPLAINDPRSFWSTSRYLIIVEN